MTIGMKGIATTPQNTGPYDYEVEYLQSTGTQYIDTGLILSDPVFSRRIVYMYVGATFSTNIVGVDTGTAPRQMHGQIYSRNAYLGNSNVGSSAFKILRANIKYEFTFVFDGTDGVWTFNDENGNLVTSYTYSGSNGWTGATLSDGLFCTHASETTYQYLATARVYEVQYYDGSGNILLDFIPVVKDGVGYMYDKVGNKLYGNIGTGSFTPGPKVS